MSAITSIQLPEVLAQETVTNIGTGRVFDVSSVKHQHLILTAAFETVDGVEHQFEFPYAGQEAAVEYLRTGIVPEGNATAITINLPG